MSALNTDTEVKVSSEAVEAFVNSFYHAINTGVPLLPFYTTSSSRYPDLPADISINGRVCNHPDEYKTLLDRQNGIPDPDLPTKLPAATSKPKPASVAAAPYPTKVRYEIESFDTHIINPDFQLGQPPPSSGPTSRGQGAPGSGTSVGSHASLVAQVTGRMRFGKSGGSANVKPSEEGAAATGNSVDSSANPDAAAALPADGTFNEVFVLVPNWDAHGRNAPKGVKRWLIMSQNFRAL